MDILASTLGILASTGVQPGVVNLPADVAVVPRAEEKSASKLLDDLFEIRLSGVETPVQQVLVPLRALRDGWSGPGSVAPTSKVIKDIETALSGAILADPELEIDIDGSVALLWETSEKTFALTFVGNGQAIGSVFPQTESQLPWALPVEARDELAARLVEQGAAAKPS